MKRSGGALKMRKNDKKTGIIFILALVLFACGCAMCFMGKVSAATATYGAAVLCMIFVFLGQFESFKGLGIEAKLRIKDKTPGEKDEEITTDLRSEEPEPKTPPTAEWKTYAVDIEKKAVEYIVKDYSARGLSPWGFYKQKIIALNDLRISVDGFIRLKEKDVLIEVKVSKTGHPPFKFLEDSLGAYLEKMRKYKQVMRRDACLEFVLVGDFQEEYKRRILSWFNALSSSFGENEVRIRILSNRDVE